MNSRPPVQLRPAAASDLPGILQLLRARGLPIDGAVEHLDDFIVAADGLDLLGAIGLERYGPIGLLRSLVVAERAASHGMGGDLVRALLVRARASGIEELNLLTTTAEAYFPRFGFSVVPRSELPAALEASAELRGACPASAVAMRLRLDAARG